MTLKKLRWLWNSSFATACWVLRQVFALFISCNHGYLFTRAIHDNIAGRSAYSHARILLNIVYFSCRMQNSRFSCVCESIPTVLTLHPGLSNEDRARSQKKYGCLQSILPGALQDYYRVYYIPFILSALLGGFLDFFSGCYWEFSFVLMACFCNQ